MTFNVAADAYDRFMGRYSTLLAPQMADLAGVAAGQRVVDVGCGPGALIGELVERVGEASVSAADPSPPFVEAARRRFPGVTVEEAPAEALPFTDDAFDAALAQLVVHFMADPVAGLREMARVTRADGVVAACVWDVAGGRGASSLFWGMAHELDPDVPDESGRPGVRKGHLGELFAAAGLRDVTETELSIERRHSGFDEWWEPYTAGVGPAGAYVASLDPERQAELRERCRARLPEGSFTVTASAWAARGVV